MARIMAAPLLIQMVVKRISHSAIGAVLSAIVAGLLWIAAALVAYLTIHGIGRGNGYEISAVLLTAGAFFAGFSFWYWRLLWRTPLPLSLVQKIVNAFLEGWNQGNNP